MPTRLSGSYLLLRRLTTVPGTPAAGGEHVYLKDSDGALYRKDSAGVEVQVGAVQDGAQFVAYGQPITAEVATTRVSLDTNTTASQYWLDPGWSLNTAKDAIVLPRRGRYALSGVVLVTQVANAALRLAVHTTAQSEAVQGAVDIPNAASAFPYGVTLAGETEESAGAEIALLCLVSGADTTIAFASLTVRYLGPATGVLAR